MKKIFTLAILLYTAYTLHAQPASGLVAYWPMNGNFTDAGPNSIANTNFGATATTNKANAANSAMSFSNPTSTVAQYAAHNINSNLNFSGSNDFSIDFSLFITSPYIHTGGLYDNNLNYNGPGVWYWNSPGYIALQFNYKNGSIASTNGAIAVNTWYHVCAMRAGGTLRIYINGVLNSSGAEGTGTPSYGFTGKFGTMFFNGMSPAQYNGHHGKIDEFRIYNRALTAAEVAALSTLALPVKFSSLAGTLKNDNVQLHWSTSYEQNSSHFNIQRSTDGIHFETISKLSAKGNTNIETLYHFTDQLPATFNAVKTFYYRLQPVDLDGQYSYSNIVVLNREASALPLSLFPNPAKDIIHVQTNAMVAGKTVLMILDASGRKIYQQEISTMQGINSIPVNISFLPKGTYRLIAGKETRSFVKE